MSIIFQNSVREYIESLSPATQKVYKSYLRAIFRSQLGRKPKDDDELYLFAWTSLNQRDLATSLQAIGYKSINPAISVWKNIIKHHQSKGLQEQAEVDRILSDGRAGDGGHWTTQALPLNALLPVMPSTQPCTDTSRHATDDRSGIGRIMDFTQDQVMRTGSTRPEMQIDKLQRGHIQFTKPDEVRMDEMDTIGNFKHGHRDTTFADGDEFGQSSGYMKAVHLMLTGAQKGSSGEIGRIFGATTKAMHGWFSKFTS